MSASLGGPAPCISLPLCLCWQMEGAEDRRKRLKAMRVEAEASNGNDVGGAVAGKYIVFGFNVELHRQALF